MQTIKPTIPSVFLVVLCLASSALAPNETSDLRSASGTDTTIRATDADGLARQAAKSLGLRDGSIAHFIVASTADGRFMIRVSLDGRERVLQLWPHSVRGPGYEVLEARSDGVFRAVTPGDVRTVRGSVLGVLDSVAAGGFVGNRLFLTVLIPGEERYWIESIDGRVAGAKPHDHIVYREDDVISHGACGLLDVDEADPGPAAGGPALPERSAARYDKAICPAELACDADFEYFQNYGSVSAVEDRINLVTNVMNLQYEREVGITHELSAIVVSTSGPGPYTGPSIEDLLAQFRNEWNLHHTNTQRDLAQLFSGKERRGPIGVAPGVGLICDTSNAYCVVESDFSSNFACSTDLSAHELGHLWGAFHCSCPSYTMNPMLTCANQFDAVVTIPHIVAHRDTRPCLEGCPLECPPSESSWTSVQGSTSSAVYALHVFDDGGGPALYVGGTFTHAGPIRANRIARWDGRAWSAVGNGVSGNLTFGQVDALCEFDDETGRGPALYAAGYFTHAGTVNANNIARWDGVEWTALGEGLTNPADSTFVRALTVFDDGTGRALYAGGTLTVAGGAQARAVAKWNGSRWSPVGTGLFGSVEALAVYDDGHGPALFAGGSFQVALGTSSIRIAKWNGLVWSGLGSSVSSPGTVNALLPYQAVRGGRTSLLVGGNFSAAGGMPADGVAAWNGSTWSSLGAGVNKTYALRVLDDGSGPALYAGGGFATAFGGAGNGIARWDGAAWHPLGCGVSGSGASTVLAIAAFDEHGSSDPALFAGGGFNTAGETTPIRDLARWQTSAIPADLDSDGVVNMVDLDMLLAAWSLPQQTPGCGGTVPCAPDLNHDGVVDTLDLGMLLAAWTL